MRFLNRLNTIKYLLFSVLFYSYASMSAGLMSPSDASLPALDIKQHHVNVVIEDGYAITSVEQVFYNPHAQELEANYSFPIPEKAAVGEFTYWIDGKAVLGEVLEKQQARQVYEEEKQAGRETALTEQDSYKSFDIKVYPLKAQQDVRIRLTYIQPVQVDTSIGRYVYPLEDGGVDEQKLSFWTYNETVKEKFSFKLKFRSSYPIDKLRLPQHPQAIVTPKSEHEVLVSMISDSSGSTQAKEVGTPQPAAVNAFQLNKDIVVYWRHKQGLPAAVDLITHKENKNAMGTFMMTLTPGDDLGAISEGRDWVFVLDYSGSMQGKYQSLIEGVSKGLQKLQSKDRFRIILFNNQAREITSGYQKITAQSIQQAIKTLESHQPNSGTNLYAGLELAIDSLEADRSSAVILVTDGVANVGQTEKKDFLKLLNKADVRLFTFVMGNSANRPLLESMTKVSNGFAMNVSNSDDIVGKLLEATSKLTHEAFHDININFSGVKVKDLTPDKISSLYRGEQLIVFGHYWGDGAAKVTVDAKVSGQEKSYRSSFNFPEQSLLNPEIERLWAFAKIEDLQNQMDYLGKDSDIEQAITDFAVNYGLVTDYTSMIVMREEQFVKRGIQRNNAQRVKSEQHARQQRSARAVRNNRVDNNQPMFNRPAASHSGGGSMSFWMVLLFLPLLLHSIFVKQQHPNRAASNETA